MRKYRSIIIYLIFGALTTLVNFLIYYPLYNLFHVSATVSNVIAWAVAVVFAYLTNKPFVFASRDWHISTVIPEFGKFLGSRLISGAIETFLVYLTVDLLLMNGNIWKIIISVIVVILNYVASKFIVFKK